MYFSVMFFFCYKTANSVGSHSGQFSLHVSHQDSIAAAPIEIGGAGGAIYLPYLVPYHSAWSTQRGM